MRKRTCVLVVMLAAVAAMTLVSCEYFWDITIKNNSDDDVLCTECESLGDTTIDADRMLLAEAGKETRFGYIGTVFHKSYSKNEYYVYMIVSADSVLKYGAKKVAKDRNFICRYEAIGMAFSVLGKLELSYPPTQEMVDAGVRVIYPDGRVWQK